MHKVTNNHRRRPIGLPDGVMIYPGATVSTARWEDFSQRKNLAWYVEQGILSAVEVEPLGQAQVAPQHEPQTKTEGDNEKAQLLAELRARGIEAGGNSKIETLREKLATAIAKEQA